MNLRPFAIIALVLGLLLMVSACGNKGPLTLPEEEEEEKRQVSDY